LSADTGGTLEVFSPWHLSNIVVALLGEHTTQALLKRTRRITKSEARQHGENIIMAIAVMIIIVIIIIIIITFTFRAFGRRFYPKQHTKSTFVERESYISLWYIKIRIEQVSSIHNRKVNRMSFIIAMLPA